MLRPLGFDRKKNSFAPRESRDGKLGPYIPDSLELDQVPILNAYAGGIAGIADKGDGCKRVRLAALHLYGCAEKEGPGGHSQKGPQGIGGQ